MSNGTGPTLPPAQTVPVSQMPGAPPMLPGQRWVVAYSNVLSKADPSTQAAVSAADFSVFVNSLDEINQYFPNFGQVRQQFLNAGSDLYKVIVYATALTSYPAYVHYRIVYIHSVAFDVFVNSVIALLKALGLAFLVYEVISHWQTVVQALGQIGQTFGNDFIAPAIKPLVNASLVFFVATTGIIFGIYFLEKGIATRTGESVALPALPAPQAPPPPAFGATTGYGVQAGPLAFGTGQQFGQTAPPAPVPMAQPLFSNRPFAPNMRRASAGGRVPRQRGSFRSNSRRTRRAA